MVGRSWPLGGSNLKDSPLESRIESSTGLNVSFPEKDMAVTIVGEARKFMVVGFPSLRDLKFLQIVSEEEFVQLVIEPIKRTQYG